jgi:hypothetical protein
MFGKITMPEAFEVEREERVKLYVIAANCFIVR